MTLAGKHIISCLLLSAVLLWLLSPMYYSIAIEKEKKAQQERIAKKGRRSEYVTMQFSARSFAQYYREADHELNIDGRLYDIVSMDRKEGAIHCTLLPDKKESELSNTLSSLTKHKKDGRRQRTGTFWLPVVFYESPTAMQGIVSRVVEKMAFGNINFHLLPADYISKQKKPPKLKMIYTTTSTSLLT